MDKMKIDYRGGIENEVLGSFPGLPKIETGSEFMLSLMASGIEREGAAVSYTVMDDAREVVLPDYRPWPDRDYATAKDGKGREWISRQAAIRSASKASDFYGAIRWYRAILRIVAALGVRRFSYSGSGDQAALIRGKLARLLLAWRVLYRRYQWAAECHAAAVLEVEAERKAARSAAARRGAATRAAAREV